MGLDINMISMAKRAINSTIGDPDNFKPLDQQIQDVIKFFQDKYIANSSNVGNN